MFAGDGDFVLATISLMHYSLSVVNRIMVRVTFAVTLLVQGRLAKRDGSAKMGSKLHSVDSYQRGKREIGGCG